MHVRAAPPRTLGRHAHPAPNAPFHRSWHFYKAPERVLRVAARVFGFVPLCFWGRWARDAEGDPPSALHTPCRARGPRLPCSES